MEKFPYQPLDDEGPVFNEPWEAQVFGLVLVLHETGLFSWKQWAAVLREEIATAQDQGDPDLGNTYYHHWLSALEKMSRLKHLSSDDELEKRKQQWHAAYLNTPHGQPIKLSAGSQASTVAR